MAQKNKVLIIQARTGSTRLKSKIVKKIFNRPILSFMIERLKFCKNVDQIVIATTTENKDDIIIDIAKASNVGFFRGSETDLLDRHYKAGLEFNADIIIKIPSDCPLSDPIVVDKVIQYYLDNKNMFDYVSNYHPPTFPDGLDVEVVPMNILRIAWDKATKDYEREHFSPYIWEHPEKFRIGNVSYEENLFMKERWTLDYEEDFLFIKKIFEALYKKGEVFHMEDVLTLLKKYPELKKINQKYAGINWYRNIDGGLKTVDRYLYMNDKPLKLERSFELLKKAKELIPCATQTLSKGYTQWSVGAYPLFIRSANGCEVTDVDGNVYIDYGMALGPFILGYSDPDVNKAVSEQLKEGTMFTLPHPLEVQVAELIIENVPCAEMIRFGKNGSDATSAAIKLARAFTGKEKIIVCGYHGWQDWYIASTEKDAGIPKRMKELVISLKYNDIDMLKEILSKHEKEGIAGLIMEPVGAIPPENNFLEEVRKITRENKVILIFDELFTGFRWSMGGAQEYFNVIPDLACFGKAIANGFPVSCIAGKREIMQKFEDVFFSFTYGGETLSLAAIIATIKKLKSHKVHEHIEKWGDYLIDGINNLIQKHNLDKYLSIIGYPFKSVFMFNGSENFTSLELKTFFQQECAKRGLLFIGYHLISYAHKKEHIDFTLEIYNDVMMSLERLIGKNELKESLEGTVVTQVFKNVGDRSAN
jgi:glutamate-1-semialdehyde 2,1-aminomutase/spore coat polysaccharide biosynthesis protein SpsF